jgi:acetylornithine deacetylase/succinyl-diaminopimelate desuccinylase-like protein
LKEIKREELIQLTQDLIRIPSVRQQGTGGSEKEVALFLSHLLEEMGLDVVVDYQATESMEEERVIPREIWPLPCRLSKRSANRVPLLMERSF